MKEHQRFAEPIITPTTKAEEGHDEDISREEIISRGLISESDYVQIEDITRKLFQRGTEIAAMFLDATADIVPNWKLATPDPMVTVGRLCKAFLRGTLRQG